MRSQEVRLATWDEFDLDEGLWSVPADQMKRAKAHIVPLSKAAVSVLQGAAALRLARTDYVFPGINGGPMSDMTLLKVLNVGAALELERINSQGRVMGKRCGRSVNIKGTLPAKQETPKANPV